MVKCPCLLTFLSRTSLIYKGILLCFQGVWRANCYWCLYILPHRDFDALNEEDVVKNNQLAFDVAEREFGIPPLTTGKEVGSAEEPDKLSMVMYLSKFYELFRGTPLRTVGKLNPDCSLFSQAWQVGALHLGCSQALLLTQQPFPNWAILAHSHICNKYLVLRKGKGEEYDGTPRFYRFLMVSENRSSWITAAWNHCLCIRSLRIIVCSGWLPTSCLFLDFSIHLFKTYPCIVCILLA